MSTYRDPALWPFSHKSPWNLPIATTATYESNTDPATVDLINTAHFPFFQADGGFEKAITYASSTDPQYRFESTTATKAEAQFHMPVGTLPNSGSDSNLIIVHPSRRWVHESWNTGDVEELPDITTVGKVARVDLHGLGIGPFGGIRAYGGSLFAGLIRKWEIDPTDPDYTDGVIRHAIAISMPNTAFKATGGTVGYDGRGYGKRTGYVWPATDEDQISGTHPYGGDLPMGSLVAIPPGVDTTAITQTSPWGDASYAIAKALQDYGAYLVDSAGSFNFVSVPGLPQSILDEFQTGSAVNPVADMRAELRVVSNSALATPGGGAWLGDASNRRAALAPPLPGTDPEYPPAP